MSEKTLKFNNIILNKKKIHRSKEPIDLLLVDLDQIVVSHKFEHNNQSFKHFIGYLEGKIVKPLSIFLPQMSRYVKYFENGGKNSWLKMMKCEKDTIKFGMWLKIK